MKKESVLLSLLVCLLFACALLAATTNSGFYPYPGSTARWKLPQTDTSGAFTSNGAGVTSLVPYQGLAGTNTITSYDDMSGGAWRPPEATVSTLPSAASSTGKTYVVTDGATSGDCTAGSGTTRAFCTSDGAAWVALGGGGGALTGAGTDGQCTYWTDTSTVAGDSGCTYDAGTNTLTVTTLVGAVTGNASTASALASNPADCDTNQYATTIAANGDLSCAQVTDAQLSTSDVTTNDASTSKHGFAPKAPNDTTKFLRGDATWAVPGFITPRVTTVSDATSITCNAGTTDICAQVNTQTAGTLTVNNPSGSPVDGQLLQLRLKATNIQTFAWGTQFRGQANLALPIESSSGGTLIDYYLFQRHDGASTWDLLAVTSDAYPLIVSSGGAAAGASTLSEGASVTRTTDQTITTATWTAISFDTVEQDDNSYFAGGSPTKLTAPATGWYLVTGYVSWDSNTTGIRYTRLAPNGDDAEAQNATVFGAVNDGSQSVARGYYLTAGDYLEIHVWHNKGSNEPVNQARLTMTRWGQATVPSAQTIAAGNTVAADACGTIKQITASGAVTTNTTDTFTAPAASNKGCILHVCNTGSNTITLDTNAHFKSNGAADVALGQDDCVVVGSTGTVWYQLSPVSTN